MIVLLSQLGRQAKGLCYRSRGHRPRNPALIIPLRPVRALQVHFCTFDSRTGSSNPTQELRSIPDRPENSNPKSTPANPKSTVDLGLEPLIWVENTLQKPLLAVWRHSNCQITTRQLNTENQKRTETNQKINRALILDLGICPSLTLVFGVVKVFVSRNSNGL